MPRNAPTAAHCSLCGQPKDPLLTFSAFAASVCPDCTQRLGEALCTRPEAWLRVWPALREDPEDDEPEPRVRRADGTSVELREVTAELKRELDVPKRVELMHTYGELGLHREQVLEAGAVLREGPALEHARAALEVLSAKALAPHGLGLMRELLFPA